MIGLNYYTIVVKKFFRKEIKHSAFFQKNIKIPVVAGLLIKMRVSNNIMTMKMVLKVNDIEQSYTSYKKINKDENELEKELYKSFMYYTIKIISVANKNLIILFTILHFRHGKRIKNF